MSGIIVVWTSGVIDIDYLYFCLYDNEQKLNIRVHRQKRNVILYMYHF